MSVEKFIRGKHDDGKHDGLYSNRKRLQEADYKLKDYLHPNLETVVFEQQQQEPKPPEPKQGK